MILDNIMMMGAKKNTDAQRGNVYSFDCELQKKFPRIRIEKQWLKKFNNDWSELAEYITNKEYSVSLNLTDPPLIQYQGWIFQTDSFVGKRPEVVVVSKSSKRRGRFACAEISPVPGSQLKNKDDVKFDVFSKKEFKIETGVYPKNLNVIKKLLDRADTPTAEGWEIAKGLPENTYPYFSEDKKDIIVPYSAFYSVIYMPKKMACLQVLLHEIAHLLSPRNEGHNDQFLKILIHLYSKYLKIKKTEIKKILKKNSL